MPTSPEDSISLLAHPFDPSPELTEKLLSMMNTARYGLLEVAETAGISIEALTLWLTTPDIAARLDAMESVFSRHCRLQLANNTSGIIHCCEAVIDYYHYSQSHMLVAQGERLGHMLQVKQGSNALMACRLLLHLARHFAPNRRVPPLAAQRRSGDGQEALPEPANTRHQPQPALEPPANSLRNSDLDPLARFDFLGRLQPITVNLRDLAPSSQGAITRRFATRDEGPTPANYPAHAPSLAPDTGDDREPAGGQHQPGEREHAATPTAPGHPGRAAGEAAPGIAAPPPSRPANVELPSKRFREKKSSLTPHQSAPDVRTEPRPASSLLARSGTPRSRDRP